MLTPPPGWRIIHQPTPQLGLCLWGDRVIRIDTSLTQAQERSVLAHEIAHADRGPVPAWLRPREERAVMSVAARRLLPDLGAVMDALRWAHTEAEAADELCVDVAILRARVADLHPSLRERLGDY